MFEVNTATRVMQLLVLPSFDPEVSYEIFSQLLFEPVENLLFHLEPKYFLVKTVRYTELPKDLREEFKDGQPWIRYSHCELDNQIVKSIFDDFQSKIPIWFHPEAEHDYTGNDGTNYELAFGGFFLGVRYRWWSHYPKEWQAISDVTKKAIALFEQELGKV